MISHGILHRTILKEIIDKGFAPEVQELSKILKEDEKNVIDTLRSLEEYHGVKLHPDQPKIWAAHPFSLAPTNFYVESSRGAWWGCCAWCSLGVAILVDEDVRITSNLGGHGQPVVIHIANGNVVEHGLYVHFPIPMMHVWDNVIYTCSNILVFNDKEEINKWSLKHNIPKGDIQPIEKVWELSKKWYINHLRKDWKKWTIEEAKEIFQSVGLTQPIWDLPDDPNERF